MTKPAADDYEFIARRIKEIEAESKGEAPKQETPQISPSEPEAIDNYYAGVFW